MELYIKFTLCWRITDFCFSCRALSKVHTIQKVLDYEKKKKIETFDMQNKDTKNHVIKTMMVYKLEKIVC